MTKTHKTSDPDEAGVGGELRRGPWTVEEDNVLIQYVSCHGQGRWNWVAKYAGLKRTGKSCRLRWLNYLKPDIKRGNLTPHEHLLILQLHSKWGNRWSKIAKHLPGRTDNEIKNYWRTRVQKQARLLQVDSNSNELLEAARLFWKPRLAQLQNLSISSSPSPSSSITTIEQLAPQRQPPPCPKPVINPDGNSVQKIPSIEEQLSENSAHVDDYCSYDYLGNNYHHPTSEAIYDMQDVEAPGSSPFGCHVGEGDWLGGDLGNSFWNSDELWQFKKAEERIIGV